MILLRFALKVASYGGVSAEQSIQKSLFNRKNIAALPVLSLSTISCSIYLLHEANTFAEYTYGVAAFSSMLVATAIFGIFIWKMKSLFYCLSLCEKKAVEPS